MRKKIKYCLKFIVISFILTRCLLIYSDEWLIVNFYRGLVYELSNGLPFYIYSDRNCCKIDDAIFCKRTDDNWYIKMLDYWYPIDSDFMLEYAIEEIKSETDSGQYRLKPEFHNNKFGHTFESIEAKILSGNPDDLDYMSLASGIYKQTLDFTYSYKDERRLVQTDYPLFVKTYLWGASLRSYLDRSLTRSFEQLQNEYVTGRRIYYDAPLLYVPFPFSGKCYLFSGDIMNYYSDVINYVHDQNFYAVLAYVPNDLRRLGKLVACDNNGVLLSPEINKTPKMKLHLKKLSDDKNYYAACVYYKRRHLKHQMNEKEYSLIMDYNQSAVKCYNIYDDQIFANLRKLLSELNQ